MKKKGLVPNGKCLARTGARLRALCAIAREHGRWCIIFLISRRLRGAGIKCLFCASPRGRIMVCLQDAIIRYS